LEYWIFRNVVVIFIIVIITIVIIVIIIIIIIIIKPALQGCARVGRWQACDV